MGARAHAAHRGRVEGDARGKIICYFHFRMSNQIDVVSFLTALNGERECHRVDTRILPIRVWSSERHVVRLQRRRAVRHIPAPRPAGCPGCVHRLEHHRVRRVLRGGKFIFTFVWALRLITDAMFCLQARCVRDTRR